MCTDTPRNPRKIKDLWENRGGPRGAGNTIEGLTHSLDLGKEGLPMNGTRICSIEGCENVRSTRGWCKRHYMRWLKYQDPHVGGAVPQVAAQLCGVDECPDVATTAGLCWAHYARKRKHGDPGVAHKVRVNDDATGAVRLARNVVRDGACLRWTGAVQSNGYGQFRVGGKILYVHRVAYELTFGPLPEGLEIDHLCRVRDCVNPDHLEAVTHAENLRRSTNPVGKPRGE